MDGVVRQYNEIGGGINMKITTKDGTVFEGTQAEYEAFIAFAKKELAEQKVKTATETTEAVEELTFEGAKYRKVDREAQAGDVVVFRENTSYCIDNGKPYLVENRGNELQVDAGGRDFYNLYFALYRRSPETVDVYEKVESKLKAGDFVAIDTDRFSGNITTDKAYEVSEDSHGVYFVDNGDYKRYKPLEVGAYTIVEPYDAKWAKIGRKVGEFRKGDIVCAENFIVLSEDIDSHIGVIEDVGGKLVGIRYANGQYCAAHNRNNNVKLIAPVEATFK